MGNDIATSSAVGQLRDLAASYLTDVEVLAVPSIQAWCSPRGIAESSPFRCGAVYRSRESGRYFVLLADPITRDMKESRLTALRMRTSHERLAQLVDDCIFLKHLLLHEIAHALDDSRSEGQCDEWAFEHLH